MILMVLLIHFCESEVKCNSTNVSEEVLHIGRTQEEADTKIIVFSMVLEILQLKQLIPML